MVDKTKKVIIEDFEYKRKYNQWIDTDGNKHIDTDNYKLWLTNIEVSQLKPEQIVNANDKVKSFAAEVQDKFKELFDTRNNNITEGQVEFSYDATISIMGQVKNPNKTTIIPAKAGFGKSSYIYSFLSVLCNHINNSDTNPFSRQGVIIVSDKIEVLRQLEKDIFKDKRYYHEGKHKTKFTYILEAWNKNSFRDKICKNEAIEQYEYGMCRSKQCPYYNNCKMSYQEKQQGYSPILLITHARFKQYQDKIDEYRTWIDKDNNHHERNIVLIDEKPGIIDSFKIDTNLFSTLKKMVEEFKVDIEIGSEDKQFLLQEILNVENEVLQLRSEVNNFRNCIYCGTKETGFTDIFRTKWLELIGYKNIELLNAVDRMFTQGSLWCNAGIPYFKTLGIKNFSYSNFKTYIFDATAELDPEYEDKIFQFLNINDYKNYENITFHIYNNKMMNMSRSALNVKTNLWKNIAVAKWINKHFDKKTYVVSYMKNVKVISQHLENKGTLIYLDKGEEKEVIPHFGDTKGSNEYKDAKSMVQIGWNRFPSDEYLAQCLSRNTNFDKLFEPQEGKTEETARYFENENGHFKKYDKANIYMWRKLAVEFEQEVFRTCVRDFSADSTVDIYIFRPDKKVIDLILQRFKKCHVIYNYNVPEEFEQEKILGRQTVDGNDNKIQAFMKWLKNEWNGSSISIQEIKDKFDISNKYWGKIVSQKVIKNIKKDRNVKTKKEGSRNNQVYYWFIE